MRCESCMAYSVVTTPEFDERLAKAIVHRIDNYGKKSARKLLEDLGDISALLAVTPRMGSPVERQADKADPNALRWVRVGRYLAVYRVHDETQTVALLMLFTAGSNWRRQVSRL